MATGTGGWVGGDDWYAKVDASVTTNNAANAVITIKCICVSQYGTTAGYNNIRGATAKGSDAWGWSSATSISTNSSKTLRTTTHTITKTHSAQTIKCWAKVEGISGLYSGSSSTASVNVTVSAKTSYTVAYNANGGSGAPGSQTKWYGENLVLSTTKPTRTGYTFKGWATSSGGGVSYASGATYTANSGATLYAVWQINTWAVSYNGNKPAEATGSVTNLPANQTKTYGTTLKLSSNIPVLPLYNFLGYATSATGDVVYQPGGNYTNNSAVTLYAKWKLAYTIPDAPTGISATNIFDGVVSNTQVQVEVDIPEVPEGSMAHRTGYNIYIDGVVLQSVSDSRQEGYSASHLLTMDSHEGNAINVSVTCVGEAGISDSVSAPTLFGKLGVPSINEPNQMSRGWSNNYFMTFGVSDNATNTYSHTLTAFVTDGVNTDEYQLSGSDSITINGLTGNQTWVNSDISVSVKAVAFDEAHSSDVSVPVTFLKATYGVSNLTATQVMGEGDDAGIGYARIAFDGAVGEDESTTYIISFDNGVPSHEIDYGESYSYDVVWMTRKRLNITVIAYRNGYSGQPIATWHSYVPQTLTPPIISKQSQSGNQCVIEFTNAQNGETIIDPDTGDIGYSYKVFFANDLYAEIPFVSIDEPTHTYTVTVNDPYTVNVSMRSIDNSGVESLSSNILRLRREIEGVCIYAYSTSLGLERVAVSNVNTVLVTYDSVANVEHCVFDGLSFYNMELATDVISERDNTFSIGEQA